MGLQLNSLEKQEHLLWLKYPLSLYHVQRWKRRKGRRRRGRAAGVEHGAAPDGAVSNQCFSPLENVPAAMEDRQ